MLAAAKSRAAVDIGRAEMDRLNALADEWAWSSQAMAMIDRAWGRIVVVRGPGSS